MGGHTQGGTSNNGLSGGHITTYGEIRFDGTKVILTNDSGDFSVKLADGPSTFILNFDRNISRSVFSLTQFYDYAGDNPYLSLQGARQGPHELAVVIREDDRAALSGIGFWIMAVHLTVSAE